MNLEKILRKQPHASRVQALNNLSQKRVKVNGKVVQDRLTEVSKFDKVEVEDKLVQAGLTAIYLMVNKPAGILSATQDDEHTTLFEYLAPLDLTGCHIAGRLDRSTTGLMIISNDGAWSNQITLPGAKVPKTYWVETAYALSPETGQLFQKGIYFKTEDFTTQPAQLEVLSPTTCRLTIYEGRYHQVKRMFASVGNRVVALHREQIGSLALGDLPLGEHRALTALEVDALRAK